MRISPASVMLATMLMLTLSVDASLAQSGSRSFSPQSLGGSPSAAVSNFAQSTLSQTDSGLNSVMQQGLGQQDPFSTGIRSNKTSVSKALPNKVLISKASASKDTPNRGSGSKASVQQHP